MSSFSHGSACSPEVGQALFLAELLSESERSLFHFINLAAENNTVAETALSECFITVANDLGSFEDLERAKIQLFKAAFERIQALQARGESLTVIIELPEGKGRVSHETLLSYALTRLPLDYKIVFFFLTDVVKFSKIEAAEIMGTTLDEVKALSHRARLMVRRVLLTELNVLVEREEDTVFPQAEIEADAPIALKH